MSLGKNIRGCGFASGESLAGVGAGAALCALPNAEINRKNTKIRAKVFIQPPEFCVA
jgi:hypothetical protein